MGRMIEDIEGGYKGDRTRCDVPSVRLRYSNYSQYLLTITHISELF